MKQHKRIQLRTRRRALRIRKKVRGDAGRPRLSVFRSNRHIYAQLVDDETGRTLAASSSLALSRAGKLGTAYPGNRDAAKEVGKDIAERAKAAGVGAVRMDRGPYKYHGRIKALAEGAREGGLAF
ncbi:MAG: 50S ribosomal protein L18 [Planctomycetota bacterium]|jgi:large subunit ribosomal protein L18